MEVKLKPIGVIHSPFKTKEDAKKGKGKEPLGEIEVLEEYQDGLKDIAGFSHVMIVWLFHESAGYSLQVKSQHSEELRGLFATRSPNRPNRLGVTVVELIQKRGNVLKVKGIDMIDGTPLLDIKPYTRHDRQEKTKFGWLENKEKD